VAIMDHGKILAMDSLSALLGRMSSDLRFRICMPNSHLAQKLSAIAELVEAKGEDGEVDIVISQGEKGDVRTFEVLSKVTNLLSESGVKLLTIKTHEPNLERLFIELTGSRLRD
jgi:ABC-type multidrug transport system ATPase subunit